VYDLESEFGATEELWFPCGNSRHAWDKPEDVRQVVANKYVPDFHTAHPGGQGELDFRVPYNQSLELFTALEMMQKVPSKLVVFPDEGHLGFEAARTAFCGTGPLSTGMDSWVKK